jgi:CBS domain-containing protein
MRINDIINSKGSTVITARADQSVRELVRLLTENRIGAVVITDGDAIIGIAGERDVVGAVYRQGTAALDAPISSLMTEAVHVCGMSDELAEVAAAMTEMRVRHFPVVVDGRLAAIVSIGDIVKSRIDQLQHEQEQLVSYLHG